jgi:serine acetyltransferase
MVGMGSVVTRSVPDFHLVLGNPARSVGCLCKCGQMLMKFPEQRESKIELACSACGLKYRIDGQTVTEG